MPILYWRTRMAETPEKVNEFLKDLLKKAKPAAYKEFERPQGLCKRTRRHRRTSKMGFGLLQ
jgi:Zn-dependent oligopeptidase